MKVGIFNVIVLLFPVGMSNAAGIKNFYWDNGKLWKGPDRFIPGKYFVDLQRNF